MPVFRKRCIEIGRHFDIRYSILDIRCSTPCSPTWKCLSSKADALGSSATSVFNIPCSLFGVQFPIHQYRRVCLSKTDALGSSAPSMFDIPCSLFGVQLLAHQYRSVCLPRPMQWDRAPLRCSLFSVPCSVFNSLFGVHFGFEHRIPIAIFSKM